MRDEMTVKVHIETMFEDRPIELEFVKQAIKEKLERTKTGCPANNTSCAYLINNICIHPMPKIKNDEIKISCGSFK